MRDGGEPNSSLTRSGGSWTGEVEVVGAGLEGLPDDHCRFVFRRARARITRSAFAPSNARQAIRRMLTLLSSIAGKEGVLRLGHLPGNDGSHDPRETGVVSRMITLYTQANQAKAKSFARREP